MFQINAVLLKFVLSFHKNMKQHNWYWLIIHIDNNQKKILEQQISTFEWFLKTIHLNKWPYSQINKSVDRWREWCAGTRVFVLSVDWLVAVLHQSLASERLWVCAGYLSAFIIALQSKLICCAANRLAKVSVLTDSCSKQCHLTNAVCVCCEWIRLSVNVLAIYRSDLQISLSLSTSPASFHTDQILMQSRQNAALTLAATTL